MKIHLNNVRLAFPVLFKPEQFNGTGEAAFSCSLLSPEQDPKVTIVHADGKQEQSTLKSVIDQVGQAKWAKGWAAVKKTAEGKDLNCLHDGDLKAKYAGFEGNMYVSARADANKRPTVVDRNRSPLTEQDGKVYAGCYVNAILEIWPQDNSFGQRVNAQLLGIQFVRDGDSFGGGSRAAGADEFAEITDGADADDLS